MTEHESASPVLRHHYDVTQMNQPTEILSAVLGSRHGINPLLANSYFAIVLRPSVW